MKIVRLLPILMVFVLLVFSGCQCGLTLNHPPPQAGPAASASPPPSTCADLPPSSTDATVNEAECKIERQREEQELASNAMPRNAMPRNAMPRNAMPRNSLSVGALSNNRALLRALAAGPLNDATLSQPAVKTLLLANGGDAQALVAYMTSCALDPESSVGSFVPATVGYPFNPPWKGQLGLCGRESESDWAKGPPSEHCLELVTACLLARTNAGGKRVVISVRGEPECLFPIRARVPVIEEYRENFGTPIASFGTGCPVQPGPVESKDCGWAPAYVGRCVSGAGDIKLSLKPGKRGEHLEAVRVCSGIYGCDFKGPPASLPAAAKYSQPLSSVACDAGGSCDVTFPCPGNGPLVDFDPTHPLPTTPPASGAPRYGYFSLMYRGDSLGVTPRQPERVVYPASEAQVFTLPEGAFYGNLFHEECQSPCDGRTAPKVLGDQMYACYSDLWDDGLAHLADRLCVVSPTQTLSPAQCFGNQPRPCGLSLGGNCAEMDPVASDGDYDVCWGANESARWRQPITVYLNQPCDLSDASSACAVKRRTGNKTGP